MAKAKMICPFSGKACKKCAVYRGRHYYLCFQPKYRGYVENPGNLSNTNGPDISGVSPASVLEMLSVPTAGILDPFTLPLKGFKE